MLAEDLTQRAINGYNESKTKQRLFTHFEHQSESWPHPRTVVAKAECQAAGTNLRFVVTSLDVSTDDQARQVYDDYIQRGESEQRNDELRNGLSMDRLSYHRFKANFWHLLLHVAACNLLNAFRDSPETPAELRHAQPQTWQSDQSRRPHHREFPSNRDRTLFQLALLAALPGRLAPSIDRPDSRSRLTPLESQQPGNHTSSN